MPDFQQVWGRMLEEAHEAGLVPRGTTAAAWAAYMQERGYALRLHGEVLNGTIVDTLRRAADGGG